MKQETEIRTCTVTVDPSKRGPVFADGLFGVNAEITRRGFFSGLSAEMLNNRKFFSGEEMPSGWECADFQRVKEPSELCGSPYVILENGGIMSQNSDVIALAEDKTYRARLWVKALTEGASVSFGVEGTAPDGKAVVERIDWQELPFDGDPWTEVSTVFGEFRTLEISRGTFTVRAKGEVAVFAVSLMPTDALAGMRRDVIDALKKIAPTSIRFPGGCAADHFFWRESLKAPEFRKPSDGSSKWFLFRDTFDQDTMDIGLNEFVTLCREVGAEPEYTVSLLLSDGEDARRLVEYCNGGPDTEYGAIRQSLGYDPFDIKLWYIGNEAYFFGGDLYLHDGAAAAERTGELIRTMKQADSGISAVIGLTWGASCRKWNFDFMKRLDCPYEYVSYHNYIGILPDPSQGKNGMATQEILEHNFEDGEDIGLNFYKDELLGPDFGKTEVCADEWNYSWGYDSSNALFFSNALQFHFFAKSREKYRIARAAFFMPVNEGMISVRGTSCKIESTGELFRLMGRHRGGTLIECGEDSGVLDLLCTDHDGTLCLSAINRSAEPREVLVPGYETVSAAQIRTGEYSFDNNDFTLEENKGSVVRGHSVLFLTLRREDP